MYMIFYRFFRYTKFSKFFFNIFYLLLLFLLISRCFTYLPPHSFFSGIIFICIMHQYIVFPNMICMKILNLKIINSYRIIYKFGYNIFYY